MSEGYSFVVVLLLLIVTPVVGVLIVVCFVVCYCMSIIVLQSSYGEERAGCFACFVFLVSHYCCVALFRGAMDLSAVCGIS